jgi:hypothetical protein
MTTSKQSLTGILVWTADRFLRILGRATKGINQFFVYHAFGYRIRLGS